MESIVAQQPIIYPEHLDQRAYDTMLWLYETRPKEDHEHIITALRAGTMTPEEALEAWR